MLAASGAAFAADIPVKAPSPTAIVATAWTGFYVGANGGYGWGSRNVDIVPNDPSAPGFLLGASDSGLLSGFSTSGAFGGVQLGYNWQFARSWLIGLEADFDWSDINGSNQNNPSGQGFGILESLSERTKWFGTVRARLGYLPTDNLLVFVTGGFAYAKVERDASFSNVGTDFGEGAHLGGPPHVGWFCAPGTTCFAGSTSNVLTGWALGGGIEYALWKNFTLKAEYLHMRLGNRPFTVSANVPFPGNDPASFNMSYGNLDLDFVRVGLNYQFH